MTPVVAASLMILGRMSDHDPRSPWTALGWRNHALFFGGKGQQPVVPREEPPVASSRIHFAKALSALARADAETARVELQRAIELVREQPPFLLDYFDVLLERNHPGAAGQALSPLEGQQAPAAVAARGRLLLAQGRPGQGVGLLQQAWEAGFRDPRAGGDFIRALRQSGDPGNRIVRIKQEMKRLWPSAAEAGSDDR